MMNQAQTAVKMGVDLDTLQSLMQAVQKIPAAGKTVWQASTAWQKGGGFQSQARIRNFTVKMDEPNVLGGGDSAPNMVEMVLGAYGCCLTTGYVLNACLRGIELEGIDIELEADLDLNGFFDLKEDVWPGYTNVRARVKLLAPNTSQEDLQALHQLVVKTSPVGSILARPVNVSTVLQE